MKVLKILLVFVLFFFTLVIKKAPLQFVITGEYTNNYDLLSLLSSIFYLLLRGFPFLVFFILINNLILFILKKYNFSPNLSFPKWPEKYWNLAAIFLFLFSFFTFIYINYNFLDAMPHVPDAVAYASQAKIFASGKLFLREPPFPEHFPIPGMIIKNGKWFFQYPFGHPLILSLGYFINLPWIIPPLLGSLSLLFIYFIGRDIYSHRIGFWTALLAFTSPFFQMNSVDFMSHNSALLITLIFTWLFVNFFKNGKTNYLFFSGLSLGYLFNIRPYTAVLISLPAIMFIIFKMIKNIGNINKLKPYFSFFSGILLLLLLYFIYNFALTGDILTSPYSLGMTSSFGFTRDRTLSNALQDTHINLFLLDKILLGWPYGLTFIFLIIYFLTPVVSKWEYLFIANTASLIFGYFLYKGSWMMFGPRFWYEIIPFLFFLIIIGVEKTPLFISEFLENSYKSKKLNFILIISYIFILILLVFNLKNWLVIGNLPRWYVDFTPENIGELKNFNYATNTLVNAVKQKRITNAVIFIKSSDNWWTYGIPSYFMDLSLKGSVIYALDLGYSKNFRIMEIYPERSFYKANYDSGEIRSYFPVSI